ncbi:hypothetical protein ACHAWF_009591 [Thalassiosira exigua]
MSFASRSLEEQEAASIVAGLHRDGDFGGADVAASRKRPPEQNNDVPAAAAAAVNGDDKPTEKKKKKRQRKRKKPVPPPRPKPQPKEPPMDATAMVFAQPVLRPAPYFYYTDHSLEPDDDPLTPITAAGEVPTFPARMHAILTHPSLMDVVGWHPNGRSWRILKPRDFEVRILARFFEHSKFSSFVRQVNGWGFRRLVDSNYKNAYYHEYFLRSMPWLCKKMRRPKVAEKKAIDQEQEPDLAAISREFPVRNEPPTREVLMIQRTIEKGAKTRMPVVWDVDLPLDAIAPLPPIEEPEAEMAIAIENSLAENNPSLTPSHSEVDLKPAALPDPPAVATVQEAADPAPQEFTPSVESFTQVPNTANLDPDVNLMEDNVPEIANATPQQSTGDPQPPNAIPTAGLNQASAASAAPSIPPGMSDAESHFAAGFMAASTMHTNQIRDMFSSIFAAGLPVPDASVSRPTPTVAPAIANLQRASSIILNNPSAQGYPNVGVAAAAQANSDMRAALAGPQSAFASSHLRGSGVHQAGAQDFSALTASSAVVGNAGYDSLANSHGLLQAASSSRFQGLPTVAAAANPLSGTNANFAPPAHAMNAASASGLPVPRTMFRQSDGISLLPQDYTNAADLAGVNQGLNASSNTAGLGIDHALQRAAMQQQASRNDLFPREFPSVASAATPSRANLGFEGAAGTQINDQAIRRLQQLQAYQAAMGGGNASFSPHMM